MALIRFFADKGLTCLLYVENSADSKYGTLIDPTYDKIGILANFRSHMVKIRHF